MNQSSEEGGSGLLNILLEICLKGQRKKSWKKSVKQSIALQILN
jgi:hypothetical protein